HVCHLEHARVPAWHQRGRLPQYGCDLCRWTPVLRVGHLDQDLRWLPERNLRRPGAVEPWHRQGVERGRIGAVLMAYGGRMMIPASAIAIIVIEIVAAVPAFAQEEVSPSPPGEQAPVDPAPSCGPPCPSPPVCPSA